MAGGAPLTFHKVAALPGAPMPDGMYFIRSSPTSKMRLVVTTELAEPVELEVAGEAVHLTFGSTGKPAAGAEFGRYLVIEDMDVADILSLAVAEIAATGQADIVVMRGSETIARFRWAPGANAPSFTALIPTVNRGDLLILTAPAVQDATLSGITGTFALLRRVG